MEFFEAAQKRHSYRGDFQSQPVSREDLTRIVQTGIQAPSGCNEQTTSFVIVDDANVISKIAEIVDKPVVQQAQAIIVCIADHRPAYANTSFAAEDCAAAVENMLLAITALNYATVWLDGVLRSESRAQKIAELLSVPADLEVRVMLPLGVPVETLPQRERLPFTKRAWFNRYNAETQD